MDEVVHVDNPQDMEMEMEMDNPQAMDEPHQAHNDNSQATQEYSGVNPQDMEVDEHDATIPNITRGHSYEELFRIAHDTPPTEEELTNEPAPDDQITRNHSYEDLFATTSNATNDIGNRAPPPQPPTSVPTQVGPPQSNPNPNIIHVSTQRMSGWDTGRLDHPDYELYMSPEDQQKIKAMHRDTLSQIHAREHDKMRREHPDATIETISYENLEISNPNDPDALKDAKINALGLQHIINRHTNQDEAIAQNVLLQPNNRLREYSTSWPLPQETAEEGNTPRHDIAHAMDEMDTDADTVDEVQSQVTLPTNNITPPRGPTPICKLCTKIPDEHMQTQEQSTDVTIIDSELTPFETLSNSLASEWNTHKNTIRIEPAYIQKRPTSTTGEIRVHIQNNASNTIRLITSRNPPTHTTPAQADTGANISATNNRDILHEYKKYNIPETVGVFSADDEQQATLKAEGEGIMKIISDQGDIMHWKTIYTPNSSGTVLSPDHYQRAATPPHFAFQHTGCLNNKGSIAFLDEYENIKQSITLGRTRNGEWLTTNKILLRNTLENKHIVKAAHRYTQHNIRKTTSNSTPNTEVKTWTSRLSTALQNMELWHQRYAHISPTTLSKTQRVVDGMPTIPTKPTPLFRCPFCEKAKLTKYQGTKGEPKEIFIPGQAYHMDLAFVSGPSNLKDVYANNTKASTTIKKSRQGHIGFLTIIDVATRALFTFPIKTKEPPIQIIDSFLKKHGIQQTDPSRSIITTSKQGYLANSRTFKATIAKHKYRSEPTEDDHTILNIQPQHLPCTVRTDGGNELANSKQFQQTCALHGYDVDTTAADASSQNGLVERPHRTLKERIRCLLYSARLGTEHWVDALRHATWLYNRTYHTAIDMTPLQAYTGTIPNVSDLITFGAKITAKKPGTRPTTTNPWAYDGIFLGYGKTMDNIRYWDIHTGTEKLTRHNSKDEVQYGDDPQNRSPASQHLLEIFTGTEHAERTTNKEPEKVTIEVAESPTTTPQDIVQEILDASPTSYITAAAAKLNKRVYKTKFTRPIMKELLSELNALDISTNRYIKETSHTLPLHPGSFHPTMGLITAQHPEMENAVELTNIQIGTIAHTRIRSWKRRLRGTIITSVDDKPVQKKQDIIDIIKQARKNHQRTITIRFGSLTGFAMSGDGIPTLQADQLNVIAHHLHTIKHKQDIWTEKNEWPIPIDSPESVKEQIKISKLTRRKLQSTKDWPLFLTSEWKQLNRYHKVGMFGRPVTATRSMTILPWVWTHIYKENPLTGVLEPKARATCNGGKRYGEAVTLAETYAACVEQPVHRLTWAVSAALNLICIGYDVGNAFAEAPAPKSPFYMIPDEAFKQWWEECLKRPPIQPGEVIPIHRALQGHPESPRLWDKHISKIITDEMGFTPTIHEPCLYYKRDENNDLILILRQVDDFLIAAKTEAQCDQVKEQIQQRMANPLNVLGTIRKFNGVNVEQTKHYNHIHCQTYIEKIVSHHNWENLPIRKPPTPMKTDNKYQAEIQLQTGPTDPKEAKKLEQQMGFNYRQCIGELIYALTICRVDIAIAVITLSQHSHNPAKIHYEAIKQVYAYLNATKHEGLTYWRPAPRDDLPDRPPPTPQTKANILAKFHPIPDPTEVIGSCDTTWASDRLQRRSMGGVVMLFAGAAVYYRTHLQPTIAQSSTEAEFTNMANAGKAAIYLRWILMELGIEQTKPTKIHADNHGAVKMANAHQPTRRTRHVEMKHFVILQWTDDEYINFVETKSDHNYSDSLSKPTGRTKFYEHTDIIMGRRKPDYAHDNTSPNTNTPNHHINLCYNCNTNPLLDYVHTHSSITPTQKMIKQINASRTHILRT